MKGVGGAAINCDVCVGQAIMKTMLGYIGKEKHADSLVEKLMLRFEAANDAAQWRNLAFCLTQVRLRADTLILLAY